MMERKLDVNTYSRRGIKKNCSLALLWLRTYLRIILTKTLKKYSAWLEGSIDFHDLPLFHITQCDFERILIDCLDMWLVSKLCAYVIHRNPVLPDLLKAMCLSVTRYVYNLFPASWVLLPYKSRLDGGGIIVDDIVLIKYI